MNRGAVSAVRALLVMQAIIAAVALLGLTVVLLLVVALGFSSVEIAYLLAWLALAAAIALALVGQERIARGEPRWRWFMILLETVVVLIGIVILTVSLMEQQWFGIPSPPAINVALALVIPVLAAINLVLLIGGRTSGVQKTP